MNNINEINEVINNIYEKIGIGVENVKNFVPMLANYKIFHSIFWIIFFSILSIILLLLIKKLRKNYHDADSFSRSDLAFGIGIAVFFMFCFCVLIIINLCEMIEWIKYPEIMTIKYILTNIGE